jgi:hypothetical protein
MIDDEELATGPDYRWRRLWNQHWMSLCAALFVLVFIVTQEIMVAAVITAMFYVFASLQVKRWDAAARGSGPGLDNAVEAALRRYRQQADTNDQPPEPPTDSTPPDAPAPTAPPRLPSTNFGRGNPGRRKPVDLPRHRP